MARRYGVIWCDNCGVEITWPPLVKRASSGLGQHDYCCQDCYDGLKCRCGERMDLLFEADDEPRPARSPAYD